MENPHIRMTQKSTSSPQTHFEEILRSQHLIMCCCPLPLCSLLLSLSHAPSPPLLPGCPGDSERHFFPEAPLSPTALFSLLCWQAHRWRRESERGEGGMWAPKLRKPLVQGGRAGGEAALEMDCAEMRMRLCFNSPTLMRAQRMQRSCFHSRDPSILSELV